jgi:hypothetical protein
MYRLMGTYFSDIYFLSYSDFIISKSNINTKYIYIITYSVLNEYNIFFITRIKFFKVVQMKLN